MSRSFLFKAGLTFAALASLLYSGCTSVPKKVPKRIKPLSNLEQIKKVNEMLVKHNDPKKVDLEVLVDMDFVKKHNKGKGEYGWWLKLTEEMNFVKKRFKDQFGIEFEVDSVKHLKNDFPKDLAFMLNYFILNYTPNKFDAFVYITGKDYKPNRGICQVLSNHLISAAGKNVPLKRVLQHELSHLFGAQDLCSGNYIMSYGLTRPSYNWCSYNQDLIHYYKDRTWEEEKDGFFNFIKRYIKKFPKEDKDAVQRLVCYSRCRKIYPESLPLMNKLYDKYPRDSLILACRKEILIKRLVNR